MNVSANRRAVPPLALVEAAATAPQSERHRARSVEAELHFQVAGGATRLGRQRVPYPFHITRAFHLDAARPDLATLYLQSASGGVYRGDRLTLSIDVAAGAAAHVTTQAATIVHDTRGHDAALTTRIAVGAGGILAYTPDPLVLFPGAALDNTTELALADGANAIVCDGFCWHDPTVRGRIFDRCALTTIVRDHGGRPVICDRGSVRGAHLRDSASPLGPYGAAGTMLLLGPGSERLDQKQFEDRLDAVGCLAGVSAAPGNSGYGARLLAPDGGTLARGLALAFALAFEALTGAPPAPRRK